MSNVPTSTKVEATATVKQETPGFRALLANRNYRFLLFAQFVSDLGDGVYALGLIWAMKVLTGSGVHMSMVLTAELVPTIVLGLFAGALVDHGSKKRFMLVADIVRGLVVAALGALWWFQELAPWMLIVAAAVLSSFSAFFTPARMVSVRTLVPAESMMQAQSLSQTTQTIVGLCAPAIAALLLSVNIAFAFFFNATSFLLSFLFIALLRHEGLVKKAREKLNFKGLRGSLKEGFRTVLTVPILRNLIIYMVLLNFMFAPISVLFPLYADTAPQLATYDTIFFAGILAGSILVGFFSNMPKIIPMSAGLLLMLIGFGALAYLDQFVYACVCMFFIGIGSPMTNVTLSSLFAVKVPREVLGRASSMVRMLTQSASPVSLSLTASMLLLFEVRDLFFYISVLGVVVVFLMIVNPVIRREE